MALASHEVGYHIHQSYYYNLCTTTPSVHYTHEIILTEEQKNHI